MSAKGESNLKVLLSSMSPALQEGEFVYVDPSDLKSLSDLEVVWWGKEEEGITALVKLNDKSEQTLRGAPIWKMITLTIHSSLEAVGFLAALLPELARAQIPVNILSGYFHDHLLVPAEKSEKALHILREISLRR